MWDKGLISAPLSRATLKIGTTLDAPTPIFDSVVADFAARGIAYVSITGGVRPKLEFEEGIYVKPNAGPLGMDVDHPTQTIEAISSIYPNLHHKVVTILDGEPDTISETESIPSPDDLA